MSISHSVIDRGDVLLCLDPSAGGGMSTCLSKMYRITKTIVLCIQLARSRTPQRVVSR